MTDTGEFTERYVAVWNEPDANARRMTISRIWSADARACTAGADYAGLTAIEARVTKAHEEFVAQQGFLFRAIGTADAHHDGVRLRWEMVPGNGGGAVSAGVQFLLLDASGRVRYDYQFIDF